jgi:exodeoxyribonuclease VII small subunit
MTFAEQLARLEEITALLEEGSLPLETLLELYEEGMRLTEVCRDFLQRAEQRVETIQSQRQGTP